VAAGKSGALRPPILDIGDDRWAEAVRREASVRSLAGREDTNRAEIAVAARALGLSAAQLYRLLSAYRANPVTQSLVVNRPGPAKGHRLLPADVEAVITEAIGSVFLRRERPTLARLCREIRTSCHGAGLKPPSRKAIAARTSARSLKEMVQARDGAAVARARFTLVRPGLRARAPLDIVQVDHTRVDVQLVDDLARAPLGRPWLTLLLDVHSRCVLGFTVSFDAPSAGGVALAIAQGVLPKAAWLAERDLELTWPMQGLPRALHLDNGREFHSRALKRGCQQFGIRIDHRPPATPHFGGHVERLMGTLMTRVHALPGTTGSNVVARGDYPSEARAVLTLREFERILALEVLGPYHNDLHAALGKSPAAAWEAGIIAAGPPRLPTDQAAFLLNFLPFEERVVRREGVRLFNIHYFDGALAPLLESPNRKHRVKYDPRDISAVFVELPEGGHIRVPYADLGKPPVSLWEHRQAVRSLHEQGRKTVDEYAIFTAISEQRQVLIEAHAQSKMARRASACTPAFSRAMHAPTAAEHRTADGSLASDDTHTAHDARVPPVADDEAWRTEFLS
jgi:putative transposase